MNWTDGRATGTLSPKRLPKGWLGELSRGSLADGSQPMSSDEATKFQLREIHEESFNGRH